MEQQILQAAQVPDRVLAEAVPESSDDLALGMEKSMAVLAELERRVVGLIDAAATADVERLVDWPGAVESYKNILVVLAAETCRRRKWEDVAERVVSGCSNPAYSALWDRWVARMG